MTKQHDAEAAKTEPEQTRAVNTEWHLLFAVENELSDAPHNAFVKSFASRQVEKRKAFAALDTLADLPADLVTYLQGLRMIWSLPGGQEMSDQLTPEKVMAVGEAWKKALLANMPAEELDTYLPNYKQRLLEQGIALAKRETVRTMFARHFDITLIADVTGLSVEQVNAILADQAT